MNRSGLGYVNLRGRVASRDGVSAHLPYPPPGQRPRALTREKTCGNVAVATPSRSNQPLKQFIPAGKPRIAPRPTKRRTDIRPESMASRGRHVVAATPNESPGQAAKRCAGAGRQGETTNRPIRIRTIPAFVLKSQYDSRFRLIMRIRFGRNEVKDGCSREPSGRI